MGFQWTAIVIVLYSELALICVLMLPFIAAKRWQALFESRVGVAIRKHVNYYFTIFLFILALCFLDSIREMRKFTYNWAEEKALSNAQSAVDHALMKKFRAERNFFISGFALFLWLVISRLVTMIYREAQMQEIIHNHEAQAPQEIEANLRTALADLETSIEAKESLQGDFDNLTARYQDLEIKLNSQVEAGGGDKKTD